MRLTFLDASYILNFCYIKHGPGPIASASPGRWLEMQPLETLPLLLFSHSVVSDSLWLHGLQHAWLPCPSPSPELDQIYVHCVGDAIQPSHPVIPFSCLQFFPASGSFLMSQLFASGGQSIGDSVSAPVLPMNTQDWSPLGWTGWISSQSKGLSRVFSNTTVQKHQLFNVQPSLWYNSHIHTWLLEKS